MSTMQFRDAQVGSDLLGTSYTEVTHGKIVKFSSSQWFKYIIVV